MSLTRALRHGLVAISGGLPLAWIDTGLDRLARVIDPERLPAARAAADALGLRGDERRRFGQRVWAGNKRSDVLWTRLARDPGTLARLVVDTPVAPIARLLAERRGLILAAVHHGPVRVAAMSVRRLYPDTLFVVEESRLFPAHARVPPLGDERERAAALVEARRHLRAGGVVYLAPDGHAGRHELTLPVRGGTVALQRGAATLARLSGAPALPITAAWTDEGVRVLHGEPIAPPRTAQDEAAWLGAWLACVDGWLAALPAENLRLYGSLWERWRTAPPAAATKVEGAAG